MLGCDAFARQTNGKRSHGIPIITARRRSSSSASALKVLPSVVDEGTLWGVRTVSAILSYVGFVGFYDRPRGGDLVDPGAVEIKPSTVPGAGLGLFARHNLPKGTVLGAYPGVLVPLSQNLGKLKKYPECEAYVSMVCSLTMVLAALLYTSIRNGETRLLTRRSFIHSFIHSLTPFYAYRFGDFRIMPLSLILPMMLVK